MGGMAGGGRPSVGGIGGMEGGGRAPGRLGGMGGMDGGVGRAAAGATVCGAAAAGTPAGADMAMRRA